MRVRELYRSGLGFGVYGSEIAGCGGLLYRLPYVTAQFETWTVREQ